MSAFICHPKHTLALACYYSLCAKGGGLSDGTNVVANILWKENIKSVKYRYPFDKRDELPGPRERPVAITWETGIHFSEVVTDPVVILKLCACYEYQTCEHPEWGTSEAKRIITAIRNYAISTLPGWQEAPWEYTGRESRPLIGAAAIR